MKHSLLIIAGIISLSLFSISCKKDLSISNNGKKFNLSKFSQELRSQISKSSLKDNPEGYSFVITKNGEIADSFSFGNARKSTAAGNTKWTTEQEINVASVTKSFTAVAVLQLLKKNNISLDSSIQKWLPMYTSVNIQFRSITFRELLSHTSGITEFQTTYQGIKNVLSKPLSGEKTYFYSNINFALFRMMIPFLENQQLARSKENGSNAYEVKKFEEWLSRTYIQYMRINVFKPAGLLDIRCTAAANTAIAFNEPSSPSQAQGQPEDWTEKCGGGGFFMSVKQMAKWMVYLNYSTNLLSAEQKKMMDEGLLGWDVNDSKMTYAGRAYGKNGGLWWDSNFNGAGPDAGDAGLQTLVMKFPNKVELALAINSLPAGWRSLSLMAATAYDAAWK